MKLIIFGKNGQVATHLRNCLNKVPEIQATFVGHNEVDLTDREALSTFLKTIQSCDYIINAAAYTNVEAAEDNIDIAFQVNAEAVKMIAKKAAELTIPLIHYSTDYVFSGEKSSPYLPDDKTGPLNIYGKSKLQGEEYIKSSGCAYYIIRTSWIFSEYGVNFVSKILKLAQSKEELSIVSDQFGCPTYAGSLAEATLSLLTHINSDSKEILHFSNQPATNWFEFASKFIQIAKEQGIHLAVQKINPIVATKFPTKAIRPSYAVLDCSRTEEILGQPISLWEDILRILLLDKFLKN